jgi:5-methylcytosine-specific restriction protein A
MIARSRELILRELEEGTGASIAVEVNDAGLRSALRIWFSDLEEQRGPIAELRPHGLKGHRVELAFGRFSAPILSQIATAKPEDIQLARALVSSIGSSARVEFEDQLPTDWLVRDGRFRITATIRHEDSPDTDAAITQTCREVIVPIMAAMAELIGYDPIEDIAIYDAPAAEGAILQSVVLRRERNPRNRLLCVRIHGYCCKACRIDPRSSYGEAGSIIEVHHLEPLANLSAPRTYDPRTDLVPLCPNCHRAVHTRRPIPYALEELQSFMEEPHD